MLQFLRLCRFSPWVWRPLSRRSHLPFSLRGSPAPDPSLRKRRLARGPRQAGSGGGRRGGAGPTRAGEVCAPPPPSPACGTCPFTSLDGAATSTAGNGNIVAILRLRAQETRPFVQASSRLSGRRGGGARRSARASGGGSQAQGPDHPPARPARATRASPPGRRRLSPAASLGGGPGGRGACKQTQPHVTM